MQQEQLRNLNTILSTYGKEPQVDMTIEECSELQKALLKFRRKNASATKEELANLREDIVDELADVEIMVEQMKIAYGCNGEVEERVDYKISRQMRRIKEEKKC